MVGNKARSEEKGFSLLEVMVALGILSIGLLAMASLFSTSQRVLSSSHKETLATHLAQNKMEELRGMRPFEVAATDTVEGMTRAWSVAKSTTHDRMWMITVEVSSPENKDQLVILKSMVFD